MSNNDLITPIQASYFRGYFKLAVDNGLDCEFLTYFLQGIKRGESIEQAARDAAYEWDLG